MYLNNDNVMNTVKISEEKKQLKTIALLRSRRNCKSAEKHNYENRCQCHMNETDIKEC